MERRRDEDGKAGKAAIAGRLRSIREEIYGKEGLPEVAERLGLPPRTWHNYESGVSIPGEVLLRYLILTGAEPLWMFTGHGDRFRPPAP